MAPEHDPEVPDGVRRHIDGVLRVRASTPLGPDGTAAPHWLLATATQVCATDEDRASALVSISMDDVESFRLYGAVGSGFVQAKVNGTWVDLIRYPKSESHRFADVVGELKALRAGETYTPPENGRGPRCLSCGARLAFKGDACPSCADRNALARRVVELLYPLRFATLALFLLLLMGILLALIPPKLTQYLIDDVLQADQPNAQVFETLAWVVIALGLTRVVSAVLHLLKGTVSLRLGTRLTATIRERLVTKLHRLQVSFYDDNQVPALATRVTRDTEALQNFIDQLTHGFLLRFLQFVAVGIMLFAINPKLALFALLPAPLVIGGSLIFWRYVYPKYFRLWDSHSRQAASLSGMLYGVRVVKAFAQEPRELERFMGASDYVKDAKVDVGTSASAYGASMSFVFSLGGLIVWYAGGQDVLDGQMTLGALMAFFGYLAMFYNPLSSLSQLTTWLSNFMAATARVLELLDAPESLHDPDDPQPLPNDGGVIRFENVTFGYDRSNPVLKDLTIDIPKGQMVGIVGKSGSGKTTLINLLCRFYDVSEGRITIDGIDIRDVDRAELRRHIGVVLQESFLFRGTIRDNLVYGHPNATPPQIITAAKAAKAHDFVVKLPFGYDTAVAERGTNLSGGERQRLAIARALLHEPTVLILDEATSNLDTESERAVQDALEIMTHGKTVLAIAHRLSTLRHAERIIVFEDGRLKEDGSHDALVAQDGVYAKLLKLQARIAPSTPVDQLKVSNDDERPTDRSAFEPRWLRPSSASLQAGAFGALDLTVGDDIHRGVAATLCFHTQPGRWISIHSTEDTPREFGIIENLADWDDATQREVQARLGRRYYLPVVESIDGIQLAQGLLLLKVQTDAGPKTFRMRWAQSHAQDYALRGKVLTDVLDNQYLIPDVEALPKPQQTLLRRFIYW